MINLDKKRGFTLVELIVVIAIVAILAAVSIVGYQGYINKARLSNDVQDAKNMSNILQAYMLANNLSEVDPAEIRAIVNIDNDYTFIPRAEGYSFWYEEASKTITVKSTYEIMSAGGDFTELTGQSQQTILLNGSDATLGASDPDPGDALEEIIDGYYLLDRGGSGVADAIFTIRNLKTDDDYTSVLSSLTASGFTKIAGHISTDFALADTLFINDFFGFTASVNGDSSPNHEVLTVIFADQIETIPSSALNIVRTLPATLRLPASVTIIERDAFVVTYEDDDTGAIVTEPINSTLAFDDINRIRVENYAFHASDATNAPLAAKAGSAELLELKFELQFTNPTTYFYNASDTYLGKRVSVKQTTEVTQNSFIKSFPSTWNGTSCAVPVDPAYDSTYAGYYCNNGSGMYDFTMKNGAEFEVPTGNITRDAGYEYSGDVDYTFYFLTMSYNYTYTYYVGNSLTGTKTVNASTVTYYADEMNWSWGAWKPTQYDYYLWTFTSGTYSNSPFALSYAVEFVNEQAVANYSNGFTNEADYISKAGVLYADTNYQVNFVDQRVKVYLSGSSVTLYGAHIVYRDASGLTIVEAKGYDADGKLIAKGVLRFVKTYDSIPVVKPLEFD